LKNFNLSRLTSAATHFRSSEGRFAHFDLLGWRLPAGVRLVLGGLSWHRLRLFGSENDGLIKSKKVLFSHRHDL